MTPEQLYRFDLDGYLVIEDAVDRGLLGRLNRCVDGWKERALRQLTAATKQRIGTLTSDHHDRIPGADGAGPGAVFRPGEMRIDDLVNHEETLLELVDHPRVVPCLRELIECPRLKSTWLNVRWREAATRAQGNRLPINSI